MINLSTVVGIEADATYPSGYRLKTLQTVVDESWLQDIVQFFQKMMEDGNIVPNGLFDNETNSYQTIDALLKYLRNNCLPDAFLTVGLSRAASLTEIKVGTNDILFVSPLLQKFQTLGYFKKKIVSATWNMDTTATFSVAHLLSATEYETMQNVSVMVFGGYTSFKPLNSISSNSPGVINGAISEIDDTNIDLIRTDSGWFNSTSWNAAYVEITFDYIPD
jgi:hypothetical protein